MGTTPTPVLRQVGILILDDDPQQQSALRQILDAEGWRVRVAPDSRSLLSELATGEWALVIANVTLTGTDGAAYLTLNELASVPAEEGARIRALFVIPETAGKNYATALEQAHLPYVIRPFHLHEFLEKVSDLLVEIKAIEAPLRQVRHEFSGLRKKKKELHGRRIGRVRKHGAGSLHAAQEAPETSDRPRPAHQLTAHAAPGFSTSLRRAHIPNSVAPVRLVHELTVSGLRHLADLFSLCLARAGHDEKGGDARP